MKHILFTIAIITGAISCQNEAEKLNFTLPEGTVTAYYTDYMDREIAIEFDASKQAYDDGIITVDTKYCPANYTLEQRVKSVWFITDMAYSNKNFIESQSAQNYELYERIYDATYTNLPPSVISKMERLYVR